MYTNLGTFGQDEEPSAAKTLLPLAGFGVLVVLVLFAMRGDVDRCPRLWKEYKRAALDEDRFRADLALSTAKYEGCGWTQLPKG
jgi:hypothetical protein